MLLFLNQLIQYDKIQNNRQIIIRITSLTILLDKRLVYIIQLFLSISATTS